MDDNRLNYLIGYLAQAGDGFANNCILKPELLAALAELRKYRGATFRVGQRVRLLVETKGDDHTNAEHVLPAGTAASVHNIEVLPAPQGLTYTVWIPIPNGRGKGIVNVFDESDGAITDFLEAP